MAYFDCIVGGSGKGNTLVVTCADDLAGATITCTNGTKTYTKTCPSTAPYEVTFYGLAAGTWTVSATVSGDTYTTTVVITDYEAELGGFSWRAWVDLSKNYTSSDFTDLDDLLDTELAVRELMSIHACVDYLAGIATESADVETIIGNDLCAKWINNRDYALDTLYANTIIADYMDEADKYFYGEWVITDNTTTPPTWGAKGNVPVMTSNTAPYGTVIFSKENSSNNKGYYAFDDNDATSWQTGTASGTTTDYIGYESTNPILVKKVKIKRASNSKAVVQSFVVEGYDGSSWTSISDTIAFLANEEEKEILTSSTNYYLGHRVRMTYNSASEVMSFKTLQFYGRELSVSVPKMATNTTPYGEAFSSSNTYSANPAYKAFDNDYSTYWGTSSSTAGQIGYKFPSKMVLKKFHLEMTYYNVPYTCQVKGSNDGTTYFDIGEPFTIDSGTKDVDYASNNTEYEYIMLDISVGTSMGIVAESIQFYGLDYSEKEFEEGTNKKWLYDHGLELETLDKAKGSTTSSLPQIQSIGEIKMMADGTDGYSNYSAVGKQLDITPYSLLRVKIGREMAFVHTQDLSFTIAAATSFPPSNGTYTDSMWIGYSGASGSNVNNPNTLGYDVSAISGVNWVICGSFYWKGRMSTLKELWLE